MIGDNIESPMSVVYVYDMICNYIMWVYPHQSYSYNFLLDIVIIRNCVTLAHLHLELFNRIAFCTPS